MAIQDVFARILGRQPKDVFQKIVREGLRKGFEPGRTKKARKWYRARAQEEINVTETEVLGNTERRISTPEFGRLYMFQYYPKHIETLPYHDRFPAVFPYQVFDGGFYGLNLHYLAPPLRALLMDALYTTAGLEIDEKSKIYITYELMRALTKFKLARPCIKRYLFKQVRSRFVEIKATEWDIALFLPLERFAVGKSAPDKLTLQKVHRDTMGYQ